MSETTKKVDGFVRKSPRGSEVAALRKLILQAPLQEDMKWRLPCYTFEDKNVVIIQVFKEYSALLFFKGALLKDAKNILFRIGQNTLAGRQIRISNVAEVAKLAPTIKAYVREAIAIEKSGAKVEKRKTEDFEMAEELRDKFGEQPGLQTAFEALTPGRQRAYLLYFSSAKRPETRAARVAKYVPQILKGRGLDD